MVLKYYIFQRIFMEINDYFKAEMSKCLNSMSDIIQDSLESTNQHEINNSLTGLAFNIGYLISLYNSFFNNVENETITLPPGFIQNE